MRSCHRPFRRRRSATRAWMKVAAGATIRPSWDQALARPSTELKQTSGTGSATSLRAAASAASGSSVSREMSVQAGHDTGGELVESLATDAITARAPRRRSTDVRPEHLAAEHLGGAADLARGQDHHRAGQRRPVELVGEQRAVREVDAREQRVVGVVLAVGGEVHDVVRGERRADVLGDGVVAGQHGCARPLPADGVRLLGAVLHPWPRGCEQASLAARAGVGAAPGDVRVHGGAQAAAGRERGPGDAEQGLAAHDVEVALARSGASRMSSSTLRLRSSEELAAARSGAGIRSLAAMAKSAPRRRTRSVTSSRRTELDGRHAVGVHRTQRSMPSTTTKLATTAVSSPRSARTLPQFAGRHRALHCARVTRMPPRAFTHLVLDPARTASKPLPLLGLVSAAVSRAFASRPRASVRSAAASGSSGGVTRPVPANVARPRSSASNRAAGRPVRRGRPDVDAVQFLAVHGGGRDRLDRTESAAVIGKQAQARPHGAQALWRGRLLRTPALPGPCSAGSAWSVEHSSDPRGSSAERGTSRIEVTREQKPLRRDQTRGVTRMLPKDRSGDVAGLRGGERLPRPTPDSHYLRIRPTAT